jgi:hypothetical protein
LEATKEFNAEYLPCVYEKVAHSSTLDQKAFDELRAYGHKLYETKFRKTRDWFEGKGAIEKRKCFLPRAKFWPLTSRDTA